MVTWNNLIMLVTVMVFATITAQVHAQSHPGVVTNANQVQEIPAREGTPQGTIPFPSDQSSVTSAPGAISPQYQQGQNAQSWPNYPYSQYNNPYYDGGSPGSFVSGVIDWALTFPSSTWDRLSEFLDNNLFPRSPATYGGKPAVQRVAPNKKDQESPELPSASPYNPGAR